MTGPDGEQGDGNGAAGFVAILIIFKLVVIAAVALVAWRLLRTV